MLKILIVEDDPADFKLLERQLRLDGFQKTPVCVDTEVDFLAELELLPDVILCDFNLPQFDAFRALDLLQARSLEIPFLVVSGSIGEERAVEALKRGASDFLIKDRLARLGSAIRRASEQHRLRQFERESLKSLRRSEAKFRALFEQAADIIVLHQHGRIVEVNRQTCELTGYAREELLAMSLWDLNPEVTPASLVAEREVLSKGQSLTVEGRFRRRDGSEFPVEIGLGLIQIEGESLTLAFVRDLTTRQQMLERSQQAQRMEAFGQLASGVAHDFNNLLTVISGITHLVVEELPVDDPCRSDLESVLLAADRAAELTAQLLSFSRQTVVEPRILNLNHVITEVLKMLGRLIGENIQLESCLDPTLPSIRADLGQIEQVLMNLAVNARDAMPGGGTLMFSTAKVEEMVLLSVCDSGCGMSPEVRAKIFEPFFTTKEVGKGTGLGLATVYGIVQTYGGTLTVESQLGQGTTFHIRFPAIGAEAPLPKTGKLAMPGGRETVLVVEDENAVRDLIQKTLEKSGYRVLSANGGNQALELALTHPGAIDLLITDVVMPGKDGRSVAEELRSLKPEMVVLFMSGYIEDASLRQGVEAGTEEFFAKTVHLRRPLPESAGFAGRRPAVLSCNE